MKNVRPAPLPGRILAYLLDTILALLLALTVLLWWVYPRFHAEGWTLLQQLRQEGVMGARFFAQLPEGDRSILIRLLLVTQLTVTATVTAYFWLSELLSGGSSLGKCMFRLRVIDASSGERPGPGKLLLRSAVSSICLTVSSLFLLPNFLWGLFRRDRRCWHDLLSGSKIERY
ncbi:MAG: RDD family protein [Puniceicoccales bacterium]|nr:RDD family protein [Puniceicoccales bacterium]